MPGAHPALPNRPGRSNRRNNNYKTAQAKEKARIAALASAPTLVDMGRGRKVAAPTTQEDRNQYQAVLALTNDANQVRVGNDIWSRQKDGSYKNIASFVQGNYREFAVEDQLTKSKGELFGLMKPNRFMPTGKDNKQLTAEALIKKYGG